MDAIDKILDRETTFDIKAESLAAYILGSGDFDDDNFSNDSILFAPLGSDRRRTKWDVDRLKKKFFESDTAAQIDINRKGLYDHLPERLFLRLDEHYENAKVKTRAIAKQRSDARKFLLPFDQAMFHPKVEAEIKEQHYNEKFPDFIENLWGLNEFEDCLNTRQKFLLCYLFPQAHEIVGDWNFTGLVFEAVLQTPVDLQFVAPRHFTLPSSHQSTDGMTLGEDSIVGEDFQDDLPSMEIVVKGITLADLDDYLEGGLKRKLITDLLCSYFLPLEVSYILRIKVTEDSLGFDLDNSVLGVSTLLN